MLYNNKELNISVGNSRKAVKWAPQRVLWSELVARLGMPARGSETLAQYLALPKAKQDELKDVGGFVGGVLAEGRRKAKSVLGRELITLDLDSIAPGGTLNALQRVDALGCAYCVYSTRKHEEARPRLRALFPLNKAVSADQYEAISRKLAAMIGIELCDPTTFEPSRLMYWPSCSRDSQFIYTYADKPFLDAEAMLALYRNWQDIKEWPQVPGCNPLQDRKATQQADPLTKPGVVGAFCRVYDVYRALDAFLPGVYMPCEMGDGRLTYSGGSTTGGAVIYDDGKYLYSHHATDPAGGKLCNAFDLVRLHLYGALDDEAKPDTPVNKLPSFAAMQKHAAADPAVTSLMVQENYQQATQDFAEPLVEATPAVEMDWVSRFKINPMTGKPAQTTDNILLVLENDPLLKGMFAYDDFANHGLVMGPVPWNPNPERRLMCDIDDAGIRHYLEKVYGFSGKERVYDATVLCMHKHRINDVKDFLLGLSWDGKPRLDTLLVEYLGAADTAFTRAVTRKSLCAAVARVMTPGCKYDTMPILVGEQGIGKSTLIKYLGKRWYSDSLGTFEGKEAQELIQGVWINELGELKGMSRSEVNMVKAFLSKDDDIFRAAYGRRPGRYPRQCVFFGTTNESEFLRDQTGNRRFWPVQLGVVGNTKNVFRDLPGEVDQIWAEAFVRWQIGESLYLTGEAEKQAKAVQDTYTETSAKEGMIREFIERPVPSDWDKRSIGGRRLYWLNEFGTQKSEETLKREKVCAAEVFTECLGGEVRYMKRQDVQEINAVIAKAGVWNFQTVRCGPYGVVKGWKSVT